MNQTIKTNQHFIKFITTILILGFLCLTPFATVEAAQKVTTISSVKKNTTFTSGNINYIITKASLGSGTAMVTGGNFTFETITIPDTVKVKKSGGKVYTLKVTAIKDSAFYYNCSLTSLKIGKNVTKIGNSSFAQCYRLKTVSIKKGAKLKTIGASAFNDDYNLENFNFSALKKLSVVGDKAFYNCYRLKQTVPYDKNPTIKKMIKAYKKYSYSIDPILAPFNQFYYVKTNNPNADKIIFIDEQTKNKADADYNRQIELSTKIYDDVKYENASKYRVKGGYIFKANSNTVIDGDELTLAIQTADYGLIKTKIKVDCPKVESGEQYILDKFTTPSMSFKDMANALNNGIKAYHIPNITVFDNTKYYNNRIIYPFFSRYYWGGIEENYLSIYQSNYNSLLATECYPFYGYKTTNLIERAIKKIYPTCKVSSSYYYTSISYGKDTVTINDYSTYEQVVKSCIKKNYTFDGSLGDKSDIYSLDFYKYDADESISNTKKFEENLKKTAPLKEQYKTLSSSTWLRIYGGEYCYATEGAQYLKCDQRNILRDTWIDGRYVNSKGMMELGATFAQHPTAEIVLTNQTYTNILGRTVTGDMTYVYDEKTNTWISYDYNITSYFPGNYACLSSEDRPSKFILTPTQVQMLNVDKNTNKNPTKGYIFDGTVKPGTPF